MFLRHFYTNILTLLQIYIWFYFQLNKIIISNNLHKKMHSTTID